MAFEKLWAGVSTFASAAGQANGHLSVANTAGFFVKQVVVLTQPVPQITNTFQIKRVLSPTELILGPLNNGLDTYADLSSYGAGALLFAKQQDRNTIPLQDISRAVFEEEPAVALRMIGVDRWGRPYEKANPVPVSIEGTEINVDTVNVDLTHLDNVPNPGDIADSVRIGDGTNELKVNADGSINIDFLLHPGGVQNNIVVGTSAVELKAGATRLANRKFVTAMPVDAMAYWGYADTVTASTGTPLFKNQMITFKLDPNVAVWLVSAAENVNVRVTESP